MRVAAGLLGLIVAAVGVAPGSRVEAAEEEPRAVTVRAEAGPAYDLQGEYIGLISGGYRRQPVGVQVAYRGDGRFEALEYPGGLPGAGWNHATRLKAAGEQFGAAGARMQGEHRELLLIRGQLHVRDEDGILRAMVRRTERHSPMLGLSPPPGAIVLFDGQASDELRAARVTDDGLLMEGALTQRSFEDFTLHVEFRLPFMPTASGQGRGNSGIYIQQRYEVQILDSFGLVPEFNDCGALYRQRPPALNMCFPPLVWQTYDINFRAARFNDDGEKIADARITVRHNGVLIHDDVEIAAKTGAGQPEGPDPRPILFQNHRDPVRYRNIWIVPHPRVEEVRPLRVVSLPVGDDERGLGVLANPRTASSRGAKWCDTSLAYRARTGR